MTKASLRLDLQVSIGLEILTVDRSKCESPHLCQSLARFSYNKANRAPRLFTRFCVYSYKTEIRSAKQQFN